MGVKKIIQKRQLSAIRCAPPVQQTALQDLKQVRSVGIVQCLRAESELELLKEVVAIFTKMQANCEIIVYLKDAKIPLASYFSQDILTVLRSKDTNWYGLLPSGLTDKFIQKNYDLLIDLSSEYFFTTSYLAIAAPAVLKIGRFHPPLCNYDIILGSEMPEDDKSFLKLLHSSLSFIKLNK